MKSARQQTAHGSNSFRCGDFIGFLADKSLGEMLGDASGERGGKDFAEMVKSVPAVARVVDEREDFEAFRKACPV